MVQSCRIEDKLTVHAWNADRSLLAVCPNNNTVIIFRTPSSPEGTWDRVAELKEHDSLVTDIAWAPRTNRILTTSQDRNAYVWNQEANGQWTQNLVILRLSAAATSAKWSADENKFAVGSGSKTVPICYYEAENNFWVSKMLKGHRSTIQSVAWHPTCPIVATACTDYKCRVYSGYLKNVDGREVSTPWGDNPKFGTLFHEIDSLGWVRDVAFSPAGDSFAFCSHNSTVTFVDVVGGGQQVVRMSDLPLTNLLFLPDGRVVGVGHSYDPILFLRAANGWVVAGKLMGAKKEVAKQGNFASARSMFQEQSRMGQTSGTSAADKLDSVHQNLVAGLQVFGRSFAGTHVEFTTSSLDGKVAFWTNDSLSAAMSGLHL